MASATSSIGGSSNATTSSNSLTSSAPSESVFLNLLVSQIQNQDPLNPTDSTQFVSQLAQFSELEQVIAIRGDTDTLAADATAGSNTNAAGSSSTTTTTPATTPTNAASSLDSATL